MLGGIALLAFMALISVLDRRFWWSYPNLIAVHFYGPRSIGAPLGWPMVSGIAFQLLIASCAGAVFGFLCAGFAGSRRIGLLGLAWGVFVFFVSEQIHRSSNPVILSYMPQGALLVAHMIYGVCLAGIAVIAASDPPMGGTMVATPTLESAALNGASNGVHGEVAKEDEPNQDERGTQAVLEDREARG